MRTGISTASFFTKHPTEACFDVLRSMNVDLTEVFISSFCEMEKGFADALAARAKEERITVHSVHAPSIQFEGQLFSPSQRVRDDAEMLFRRVCYVGNVLGAKYYTFHGCPKLHINSPPLDLPRHAERLRQLIEIAKSYGIFIAYENVHYCMTYQPETFKALLSECPDLRATLDIKHALFAGIEPLKFVEAMGDRLMTVHAIDVSKDGDTALPGTGRYDFKKFFKELIKSGIDPVVLIESYRYDYKHIGELEESYNYIKDIIKELS